MSTGGGPAPYPGAVGGGDDRARGATAPELVEHLFALVDHLRTHFEAAVADFDLSAPQAKALRYLASAGPVPMRELADRLRCDASNVTALVDRLERRGLVERRPAPGDRRVKTLVVTHSGADLAERLWLRVVGGGPVHVLAPQEQLALLELLRRLEAGPSTACWVTRRPAV